jgi:hypothetical protein
MCFDRGMHGGAVNVECITKQWTHLINLHDAVMITCTLHAVPQRMKAGKSPGASIVRNSSSSKAIFHSQRCYITTTSESLTLPIMFNSMFLLGASGFKSH